ncbi:hypothetical protein ACRQEF_08500 [Actinotignum sp. GS-2025a]|uniref:hypothetical protein n=1 Tax=Actinotignum sp. GS-2025a TaxID=3427274 RepID=UPI003F488FE5
MTFHPRVRDAVLACLLMLLCLGWAAWAFAHNPSINPVGEWTYLDYSLKASSGTIPAPGDVMAPQARQAWACHAPAGTAITPPPCDAWDQVAPADWPYRAENYNAFHPPLYFLVDGAIARLAGLAGLSFLTGARLGSAVLVAAGVGLFYAALRAWRLSPAVSFAAALFFLAVPSVAASATMVHNDAVGPLAGAAAVWLSARIVVGKNTGWVLPALITAAICLSRVISVTGILAILVPVTLAVCWPVLVGFGRAERRPLAVLLGTQVLTVAACYLGWDAIQGARTPEGYVPAINAISTSPVSEASTGRLLLSLLNPYGLTNPGAKYHFSPELISAPTQIWGTVAYVVLLAGPLLALVAGLRSVRGRVLGLSGATGPLIVGVVVQAREIINGGLYFRSIPRRYGIANVAGALAAMAHLADRPIWRGVFMGAGALGYLCLLAGPVWA